MTSEFLKEVIVTDCRDYDIVVLKGFYPGLIKELGNTFNLLDSYVIEQGRISLDKVNESRFMMSILNSNTSSIQICTCESLIKLSTSINGLDILQKKICVLENNMLELYPNPTDIDIPDFDSDAFMNTDGESSLYGIFYAYCICENGEQKVQYIDNYSMSNSCISIKKLAEPISFNTLGITDANYKIDVLSTRDGSLDLVMRKLYDTMNLDQQQFAIEVEELENEKIGVFVSVAKMLGLQLKLYTICRDLNIQPRDDLYPILKHIWGYDSFRNLKIYKDLHINHDSIEISQGTIIETVIKQAEYAYNGEKENVHNVLLTAPTGAGKSLLFQLSAIYLAERYGLLTIIVSPLVALMNDQVEGLSNYDGVATLNSNKTASEKERILNGVLDGEINLLYLSPELLLSYSITSFIGSRKLGLLVVDEAHTVTTWGRDFRVDYWFLGDYLRKARRNLKYSFPIFALTATAVWDPSGKNDMVFDTIRSLNMDPCIKFIGVVRRNNIVFEIEQSNIVKNYDEKRKQKTIDRIKESINENKKTIVYFPFKRTIDSIVFSDEVLAIKDKITRYYSGLFPDEKLENAKTFRDGTTPIMCATKAFGMGIDVSDINVVYHHAPTGCLSDYVQEIGRLARDPRITGIAKIDFSEKDFKYIRQLHGLSAIKPYQLMQVLKKIMAIYKLNGEKRNMLISPDDFAYIFPMSTPDMIDQNVKSCLLLLSNDLLNKLRFHAIIVRPKSLFSKCYIELPMEETKSFYKLYYPYLSHITDNIYNFDADKYWTEKNNNISFPSFKAKLAEGKIFKDFNVQLRNKITLALKEKVSYTKDILYEFFRYAHEFLGIMSSTGKRLKFEEIKSKLPVNYDRQKKEQFLETFRMLYATPISLGGNVAAYCNVFTSHNNNGEQAFQLMQSGYENISQLYLSAYDNLVEDQEMTIYCDFKNPIIKLCEFMNSLGVADYQRQGGSQPAIFIRINNPYYLNMLIRDRNYENDILESIYEKYHFSERIYTYFFTAKMTNEQRWDFIEEYFLGASEERLLNFV